VARKQEQMTDMALEDVLYTVMTDDEANAAYQEDPQGYLEEQGYGEVTAEEVEAAMPQVLERVEDSGVAQVQGGDSVSDQDAATGGAEGAHEYPEGIDGAIEAINQYSSQVTITETNVSDDDTTFSESRESAGLDQSSNDDILAGGDVFEESDNDAALGEDSATAGDYSQVNTGDEAVQTGGDVYDSTQATGDVAGSVTGDNYDSVVGDGNQTIDDSQVGSAAFGGGDSSNLQAENANLGDGTIVDDTYGDATTNSGDGTLTEVEDSLVSESSIGGGDVFSDDPTVAASEGSSIAFGEGSTSSAEDMDTSISGNSGTVQVADDGTQSNAQDFSTNDSFNTSDAFNTSSQTTDNSVWDSYDTEGSHNLDESVEDNSWNSLTDDHSTSDNSWTDNSVSDDDGYDIDAHGYGEQFGGESGYDGGLETTPEPEPELDPGAFGS
jgi:hypothetical protein